MSTNLTDEQVKENIKKYITNKVFDKSSIKELQLLDGIDKNYWIFNFKSAFFDKAFAKDISFFFWRTVFKKFPNEKSFVIGGLESGAIPVISAIVLYAPKEITVTGFYIRKSQKKSDLAKKIEGDVSAGTLILVDDILNRGFSFTKAILILEKEARSPDLLFSIIRYRDMKFYESKEHLGNLPFFSIFELNDFTSSLGVKNFSTSEEKSHQTLRYNALFAKKISPHNPYYVIPKSAPVLNGELIFQGQDNGSFVAISKHDGQIVWSYQVFFGDRGKRIFSSPVVLGNQVFFGAYDGNLYSLDTKTGERQWVFFDADWIGSSPCAASDIGAIFIGLEFGLVRKKGGVAAVDVKTGKLIWSYYDMGGLTHASPAYSQKEKIVICGSNDKKIYALNAKSGTLKWCFETEGEVKYGAIFNKDQSLCFIGSMDGAIYVLKTKSGELVAKYQTLFGIYSDPVLHEDRYLIVGSLDKNIYCWDTKYGNLVWKVQTNGRIFASPLLHKNRIYIGSNDGFVRVLDPASGAILGVIKTPERVVNKVIVDAGHVYVPTHTCELLCFKEENL